MKQSESSIRVSDQNAKPPHLEEVLPLNSNTTQNNEIIVDNENIETAKPLFKKPPIKKIIAKKPKPVIKLFIYHNTAPSPFFPVYFFVWLVLFCLFISPKIVI